MEALELTLQTFESSSCIRTFKPRRREVSLKCNPCKALLEPVILNWHHYFPCMEIHIENLFVNRQWKAIHHESWMCALQQAWIDDLRAHIRIRPYPEFVFNAFNCIDPERIHVIILNDTQHQYNLQHIQQGVMYLQDEMTHSKSQTHALAWQLFLEHVFDYLNTFESTIVFVLIHSTFSAESHITNTQHCIIRARKTSLSLYARINQQLKDHARSMILW